MTRSRSTLLFSIIAAGGLLASACSSDASTDNADDSTDSGGTTASDDSTDSGDSAEAAVVTLWLDDNEVNNCMAPVVIDSFESDSITIETTFQATQWDTTRTAIAGGAGPDIVVTPGPSTATELASAGALVPLGSYVDSLGMDESIVDWALKVGVVNGELYSVPTELETMVLYYNKTLFEENGWEPPTTTEELNSLAQEISDAGITPFAAGNAEWRAANEWLISAILNGQAGPEAVYGALTGAQSFNDPAFAEAISTLNDFQQNGWISGGLDRYYTTTFDEFLGAFGKGEAAMDIEGSWRLSDIDTYFADTGNDWDWVAYPSSSGEETFAIGVGATFSINNNSEVKDQAAEFLAHMFKPETQAALATDCFMAPAPVRLSIESLDGLDARTARLFAAISEASDAGNYGYLTWTFWPTDSNTYMYEEIERVWNGDITPQEYVDGLGDTFSEEFGKGEAPPVPAR